MHCFPSVPAVVLFLSFFFLAAGVSVFIIAFASSPARIWTIFSPTTLATRFFIGSD